MSEAPLILLVEDDENDAELALRALSKAGLAGRVARARDGEEALDFLFGYGALGVPPAAAGLRVVLLDLKLPKVDGLQVLRRIRADGRTARIPVVVLTSSMLPADVEACWKAGATSYVIKPVEFASHSRAIQGVARYWTELNVAPAAGVVPQAEP
jgi:CheY-like chemotaxis protein